jgi:hypothetical protein
MKTEVYSWRLAPQRKAELEAEARREGSSLADLLEAITQDWLAARHGVRQDEEAEQERLHKRAAMSFGVISGGDPDRSQSATHSVRQRLRQRHGSQRAR